MIVSTVAVNTEKIKKLHCKSEHNFWTDLRLKQNTKNQLKLVIKISICFAYLFWLLSLFVIIMLLTVRFEHPKSIYNENWPQYLKYTYKTIFALFVIYGYYIGNMHATFYVYVILRNYYHVKILCGFLREEMLKYRKVNLKKKLFSKHYQHNIKVIFLESILQYQKLRALVCAYCWF